MVNLSDIRIIGDDVLREKMYVFNIRGMQVFIMPKKGFRRKYAEIFVRYGSNDNSFVPPTQEEICEMPPGMLIFWNIKCLKNLGKTCFRLSGA